MRLLNSKVEGEKGQNNTAVSKLEDRSADRHYFNTFWVSASSSSKRVTSFFRRITSCSSWLRSLMCVWWEATRLCFRSTFSWVLWGGDQGVTGPSELLCKECKVPMNTVKENEMSAKTGTRLTKLKEMIWREFSMQHIL